MKFGKLVGKIQSLDILLPYFQRGFVWTDEEQQRKIVASVLAKMPVGSILLLKANSGAFSSRPIGNKNKNLSLPDKEVDFLLDGQQRVTVLTNVFSSVVFDQTVNTNPQSPVGELASQSLKRRFFLKIKKWTNSDGGADDMFGVKKLDFPDSLSIGEPDILTSDILPYIHVEPFLSGKPAPYNPYQKLSTDLDNFCIGFKDFYLVPLFLLIDSKGVYTSGGIIARCDTILEKIAQGIIDEIEVAYKNISNPTEKTALLASFFDSTTCDDILNGNTELKVELGPLGRAWKSKLERYLRDCLDAMRLGVITVSANQRSRAIDIYENLNRGGVCLNVFDLVTAIVAKKSTVDYKDRIVEYLEANNSASSLYDINYIDDTHQQSIFKNLVNYNALKTTKSYDYKTNSLNQKFINAFLDVLALYCKNPSFDSGKYDISMIKKETILSLTPDEIDNNTEHVCDSLNRTMFFLQARCGIRYINEMNYSLMLIVIGIILSNDNWNNKKTTYDLLEAWYWASLFSGVFDKDQNTEAIRQLKALVDYLSGKGNNTWLVKMKDNVLQIDNFNDRDLLLMKKVSYDRYPKQILKSFVCQFYLSIPYKDMFDDAVTVSVFNDVANDLEAHHIIPLGSIKKLNQLTAALRKDPKNICNSPLNFVYITRASNKTISDLPLPNYYGQISSSSIYALQIPLLSQQPNDKDIETTLSKRYDDLRGAIITRINKFI